MIQIFYGGLFLASLICAAVYIYLWHKHFDVNFTMIFTLVPVACLGYVLQGMAESQEGFVRALQVVYIGGCFLPWLVTMCEINLCRLSVHRGLRMAALLASTAIQEAYLGKSSK